MNAQEEAEKARSHARSAHSAAQRVKRNANDALMVSLAESIVHLALAVEANTRVLLKLIRPHK